MRPAENGVTLRSCEAYGLQGRGPSALAFAKPLEGYIRAVPEEFEESRHHRTRICVAGPVCV